MDWRDALEQRAEELEQARDALREELNKLQTQIQQLNGLLQRKAIEFNDLSSRADELRQRLGAADKDAGGT